MYLGFPERLAFGGSGTACMHAHLEIKVEDQD